jgi:Protein of unknown function (DUF4232)
MRKVLFVVVMAVGLVGCGSQAPTLQPLTTPSPAVLPTNASDQPSDSEQPSDSAEPSDSQEPTDSEQPSDTPAPTPKPTPKPLAVCKVSQLAARVTRWEGALGHQIATVTLKNVSSTKCTVRGTPEVELVDKKGVILMDSQTNGASGLPHIAHGATTFRLSRGGFVTTQVQVGNYCGAPASFPTTVAFVLPSNAGRIVAAPGPGGTTPDCLRGAGTPGDITMKPWHG